MEDSARVAKLVGDEDVSRWTSNIPFPYTESDAIAWITSTASDSEKFSFAVELNSELVACVSYWPYEGKGIEVGYWVGKEHWGKGVCTKALSLLLTSEDFPAQTDVFAKVMEQNTGSVRVLEKCGFSFLQSGATFRGERNERAKVYVRRSPT